MTNEGIDRAGIATNRDIHLSAELLEAVPFVAQIAADPRFIDLFDKYEAQAKKAKRFYVRAGVTSVVFAVAALEFETVSLTSHANTHALPRWSDLVFPALALASVSIVVLTRLFGFRRTWLISVYRRERLRQWRHQLLLDGPVMDMIILDPEKHRAAVELKWARFLQDLAIADGRYQSFIGPAGVNQALFSDTSTASIQDVREQVLEFQRHIRLDYQLAFADEKLATEGSRLSLREITYLADWVSTTTFAMAIGVAVAIFIFQILHASPHSLNILGGIAVGLAVASAGTRAVRSGLTIPNEAASYAEFAGRIQLLGEDYSNSLTDDERWQTLVRLEYAAAEELRRFLSTKRESRFIF